MSEPHTIRLRGPWMVIGDSTSSENKPRRVKLPATWAEAAGEADSIDLVRPFHRPTILEDFERVTLRIRSPHTISAAMIDETAVSEGQEITSLLSDSNRLLVSLACEDRSLDASILEVQLEITEI